MANVYIHSTWNSTDSQFAYPAGNMKHKENPLFKRFGYKPVRAEIHMPTLVKNPVHIYTYTLEFYVHQAAY